MFAPKLISNFQPVIKSSQRSLWGWLNSVFNKVDKSRIEEVGPDRACAEWLIKNGAGVKWNKSEDWFRDYNSLPVGNNRALKITEIDATDSSINSYGFPYFIGLEHVQKIIFHKSSHIDNEALKQLSYVKHTLKDLQISSCGNVNENGILTLSQLIKLEKLFMFDLPEIKDKDKIITELSKSLPNCKIEFPYAQHSETITKKEEK